MDQSSTLLHADGFTAMNRRCGGQGAWHQNANIRLPGVARAVPLWHRQAYGTAAAHSAFKALRTVYITGLHRSLFGLISPPYTRAGRLAGWPARRTGIDWDRGSRVAAVMALRVTRWRFQIKHVCRSNNEHQPAVVIAFRLLEEV